MPSGQLSKDAVTKLAEQQWSDPLDVRMAVEIAWLESRFIPTAHNVSGLDDSYGLWQINMKGSLGPARRQAFGITADSQLFDPQINAKAAHIIWTENGKSFFGGPGWSTSAVTARTYIATGISTPNLQPGGFSFEDILSGAYRLALGPTVNVEGANIVTDATGNVGGLLDWAKALGKILSILLDPTFWKRLGIGLLGASIILIAIAFYNKDTITSVIP